MTLVSIPLMDRTGRRTLHLYGLGGMFIFSIFITISFLIKASTHNLSIIIQYHRVYIYYQLALIHLATILWIALFSIKQKCS